MVSKNDLLFLFREGYSLIVLPLNLLTFATTTYYLLIENVPFLKMIFPEFWIYLLCGVVGGLPGITILGILYVRSPWYKASTKNNPYSYLLVPASIPLYRAVSNICKIHSLPEDVEALDKLIQASEDDSRNG
jgi:hypothetical protein